MSEEEFVYAWELEDTDPRWVEDQSISYANEYLIAQGE